YGTCTTSTPARLLKISPARCGMLPFPADGKLSFPGRCFKYATSSRSEVTGKDGWTTTKCGTAAVTATGAKSLFTSYGRLEKSEGAIAFTETWPIMMV